MHGTVCWNCNCRLVPEPALSEHGIVRSGEWVGDEALQELRKPDAAGRWECKHELSVGWDGVDVRHIDPPDVPLVRYADRWHDAEWMILNGWVAWRRAVNASSPTDGAVRQSPAPETP